MKPEWERLVTYEDDDDDPRFDQRLRSAPRVTPSKVMLQVAEEQRARAETAGRSARSWAIRAAVGFGLMLFPTPLMPVFFLYFVFAAIMAATAAIAAWNARTGAQLARDSAIPPRE